MRIYLVGGAVRDKLLEIPTKDHDWVVVGSAPDELISLGFKQVGSAFPVFLHPDTKEEYALARTERKIGPGYTGFETTFDSSVTLEQDLERRDLTINAIAQNQTGELIDPFNGQKDLKNRILRHVSPAFKEDPLRVLRVARFAARFSHLGFTIAPETIDLIEEISTSGELEHLVSERIWTEMSRALVEPSPSEFFRVLRRVDALKTVFPELDKLFGVPQTMRWHPEVDSGIHTLKALEVAREITTNIDVLLATLCHDLGKGLTPKEKLPSHHGHEKTSANIVKQVSKRMKWPTKSATLAEQVARYHPLCHIIDQLSADTLLTLLEKLNIFRTADQAEKFAMACEADFRGRSGFENHVYTQRDKLMACASVSKTVQAQPFVDSGLTGKAIGEAMREARVKVLNQLKSEWH